jgi:hypothetical protein
VENFDDGARFGHLLQIPGADFMVLPEKVLPKGRCKCVKVRSFSNWSTCLSKSQDMLFRALVASQELLEMYSGMQTSLSAASSQDTEDLFALYFMCA